MSVETDDNVVKKENGINNIYYDSNNDGDAEQNEGSSKISEQILNSPINDELNPKLWDVQASPIEIMKLENKFKSIVKNVETNTHENTITNVRIEPKKEGRKSNLNKQYSSKNSSQGLKKIGFSRFMGETCCKELGDPLKRPMESEEDVEAEGDFETPGARVSMPSLEELPNDEEELEKLLKKWISEMKPSWRRHRSGKPYPPGTMGSATNIDYRLADMAPGADPAEAVTEGRALCACEEEISFQGETDSFQDIENKMEELKKNHKTTRVIVRIKKKKAGVKEKIATKQEAHTYTGGPALLTKYCLERVCDTIGSHPKLSSLKVEGVPLSQPCRAMLVPSFATLRELSLISTKLGDDGVKLICRYAWRSPNLRVVDLTDNGIRPEGVKYLTQMIERRGVIRTEREDFFGVERIILDKNPIGYRGFKELLKCASDDFYLKALDLRDCQISRGDEEALELVRSHRGIEVLDLRGNNLRLAGEVARTVLKNCPQERALYKWRDSEDLERCLKTTLPVLILRSE